MTALSDAERMEADLASHHIEGFAYHGDTQFHVPLVSHITGNLWTGGCYNDVRLPDDFKFVVSLYQWERYAIGPDTVRFEIEMYDSTEDLDDVKILGLGRMVNGLLESGKTLVHCQAGLNRSSLIAGTALFLQGWSPSEAIDLLRQQRSDAVLCNPTFEAWLRGRAHS